MVRQNQLGSFAEHATTGEFPTTLSFVPTSPNSACADGDTLAMCSGGSERMCYDGDGPRRAARLSLCGRMLRGVGLANQRPDSLAHPQVALCGRAEILHLASRICRMWKIRRSPHPDPDRLVGEIASSSRQLLRGIAICK